MKWVEVISLRCPENVDMHFMDELLKDISESDSPANSPNHLVEIKAYRHFVVETDLSIHIYWRSEQESQHKSPIGLRVASALKPFGLLNHSVWVETTAEYEGVKRNEQKRSKKL